MTITFLVEAAVGGLAAYTPEWDQGALNVSLDNGAVILHAAGLEPDAELMTASDAKRAAGALRVGAQYLEPTVRERNDRNMVTVTRHGRDWDQLGHYADKLETLAELAELYSEYIRII